MCARRTEDQRFIRGDDCFIGQQLPMVSDGCRGNRRDRRDDIHRVGCPADSFDGLVHFNGGHRNTGRGFCRCGCGGRIRCRCEVGNARCNPNCLVACCRTICQHHQEELNIFACQGGQIDVDVIAQAVILFLKRPECFGPGAAADIDAVGHIARDCPSLTANRRLKAVAVLDGDGREERLNVAVCFVLRCHQQRWDVCKVPAFQIEGFEF